MIFPETPRKPSLLWNLRRDERGTTAVEFALVGLLLFIVSFGIIDFGLAYWQWVMAEKATQVGVRKAVVSNMVAQGLTTWPINNGGTSANGTACTTGTTIITDCSFSPVTCTSNAAGTTITCSCPSTPCPKGTPAASDFTAIVAEMQKMDPYIANNNVQITYSQNGLGFVGRPNGLPVTVTVTLTGMTFRFLVIDKLVRFGGTFSMPPFNATLVGEDLSST
jgi:Flp pilus assembly protein TadG